MTETQLDLPRFGTVTITADVSVGRAPPLAVSEATYMDCGDGAEVDLRDVRAEDDDSREVSVLALLTPTERARCEAAALEAAHEPYGLD